MDWVLLRGAVNHDLLHTVRVRGGGRRSRSGTVCGRLTSSGRRILCITLTAALRVGLSVTRSRRGSVALRTALCVALRIGLTVALPVALSSTLPVVAALP